MFPVHYVGPITLVHARILHVYSWLAGPTWYLSAALLSIPLHLWMAAHIGGGRVGGGG